MKCNDLRRVAKGKKPKAESFYLAFGLKLSALSL